MGDRDVTEQRAEDAADAIEEAGQHGRSPRCGRLGALIGEQPDEVGAGAAGT